MVQRVFIGRDRQPLGPAEADALVGLAARVRELTEAVLLSGADAAELGAVAEDVRALTARLSAVRHPAPPVMDANAAGVFRQLGNPVTGAANPIAPPIEITTSPGGTARAEFTLGPVYEGPPGAVHGGVCAMILDNLFGYAAMANGTPGMTAGLDMRYRRPTPYGVPLRAEAAVVGVEGRKTFVEGAITTGDGRPTAEATGVFIMPDD